MGGFAILTLLLFLSVGFFIRRERNEVCVHCVDCVHGYFDCHICLLRRDECGHCVYPHGSMLNHSDRRNRQGNQGIEDNGKTFR